MKTTNMYEVRIEQLREELKMIEANRYEMEPNVFLQKVKDNVTKQKELMKKEAETLERMNPTPRKQSIDDFLTEIEKHLREIANKLNEDIDIKKINVKDDEKAEKINDFILGKVFDMSFFTVEELRVMNVIKRNI